MRLMWVGHSCPTVLNLMLLLISEEESQESDRSVRPT